MNMHVIIASSGSGGHLFCGLSIAQELKKTKNDIKIFFFGSGKDAEKSINEAGFKYYRINAVGLQTKGFIGYSKFLIGQMVSIVQAGILLFKIKPKAVISTGGFASFGAVLWSKICGIPCIIHEQNVVPGKANNLAGRFADKILVSFKETGAYFKGNKSVFTGMPVRSLEKVLQDKARQELGLDPKLFTILIMGGSKGSHRINEVITGLLDKMPNDVQIIHLTGMNDLDFVKQQYDRYAVRAYIAGFCTKMGMVYSASDAVICRAGSGTLAEISLFGLPALLVPYPYSSDRHQYKNAQCMAEKGAAKVVSEDRITEDILLQFIKSRDKLREMSENSAGLGRSDAVSKIVSEVMELING